MWTEGVNPPFAKGGDFLIFGSSMVVRGRRTGHLRRLGLPSVRSGSGSTCNDGTVSGPESEAKNTDFPVISGQNRTFGLACDGIWGAEELPGAGCVLIPGAVAGQESGKEENTDFPVKCGQNRTFGVGRLAGGRVWGGTGLVFAGCLVRFSGQ